MRATLVLLSTMAVLPAAAAWGQADPATGQQPSAPMPAVGGQQQVAEQCQNALRAFGERVDREGYWLTGWREARGAGIGAPPAAATATGAPADPAASPGGAAAPQQEPVAGLGAPAAVGPWGNMTWQQAPALELGTLYDAANILAARGDEQGCQTVLASLDRAYGEYAGQLREAGVDPNAVSGWRAQEILAAKPVTDLGRTLRLDDIAGTDLRTPNDQYLGSVEDVVLDPQSGGVAYAVVERGAFLGIGGDSVAVPWSSLKATPGLNLFVLDVDEAAMEGAPTVEPGSMGDPAQFQQRRQEIDRYWQQHLKG
jgi:sporulation protein YlmC with PRC-barrel domain